MSQHLTDMRGALLLILHGLFWAFAMILADALWGGTPAGEKVAPWMAVAFVIVNGILGVGLVMRSRSSQ
jgi:hypothetical protein